ncbi:MAG: tRNA (adenosine(37)-N6)-threonylcarbamoyltransferase complex ATPase subunit type 1 TsaE [Pseudomonadota bacterium]
MTPLQFKVHSTSPDQTQKIAASLAPVLGPGDTLLLEGPIGAGKSHFARATILALLPQPEDIPSPTYTLVQSYHTGDAEIWHADLYRLGHPHDAHELGLLAAFDDAICLVEWPDRLGADLPDAALTLAFEPQPSPDARHLTFTWSDARWTPRMKEVFGDRSALP